MRAQTENTLVSYTPAGLIAAVRSGGIRYPSPAPVTASAVAQTLDGLLRGYPPPGVLLWRDPAAVDAVLRLLDGGEFVSALLVASGQHEGLQMGDDPIFLDTDDGEVVGWNQRPDGRHVLLDVTQLLSADDHDAVLAAERVDASRADQARLLVDAIQDTRVPRPGDGRATCRAAPSPPAPEVPPRGVDRGDRRTAGARCRAARELVHPPEGSGGPGARGPVGPPERAVRRGGLVAAAGGRGPGSGGAPRVGGPDRPPGRGAERRVGGADGRCRTARRRGLRAGTAAARSGVRGGRCALPPGVRNGRRAGAAVAPPLALAAGAHRGRDRHDALGVRRDPRRSVRQPGAAARKHSGAGAASARPDRAGPDAVRAPRAAGHGVPAPARPGDRRARRPRGRRAEADPSRTARGTRQSGAVRLHLASFRSEADAIVHAGPWVRASHGIDDVAAHPARGTGRGRVLARRASRLDEAVIACWTSRTEPGAATRQPVEALFGEAADE